MISRAFGNTGIVDWGIKLIKGMKVDHELTSSLNG